MIVKKIKNKIENNRGSSNIFWKTAVFLKDSIWFLFNFIRRTSRHFLIWLRKDDSIVINGKINLLSFKETPNFGDRLSDLIVEILSGKKCNIRSSSTRLANKRVGPCLLAVGSLIDKAIDGDMVWGSGIRKDKVHFKKIKVFAVRGPLTRKYLLSKGIQCPEIYGDPTILLPEILNIIKEKKYRIGVIRHFNDESGLGDIHGEGIIQIDVSDDPIEVVKKICQCENIISSSLHGIIVAESFDIPACWAFPDKTKWKLACREPDFKFKDYYLSTGREPVPYEPVGKIDLSRALEVAHKNKKPLFNKEELLMNFPFLREDIRCFNDLKGFRMHV